MFGACQADICVFGGAAGGGKSWAMVYEMMRWAFLSTYNAIVFRRTTKQLRGGGSIWQEAFNMYKAAGAEPNRSDLSWRFPSGAGIEFGHLQYEDTVYDHQSKQYALICFDELTHFTQFQFWYMFSRLRTASGVRPYVRAATNPDPDSWVLTFLRWWIGDDGFPIPERSGVIRWLVRPEESLVWFDSREEALEEYPNLKPISVTFIASRLDDNKKLLENDPDYAAKLESLPKVQRMQLRFGNWHAKAKAGDYFQREDFEVIDKMPPDHQIVMRVRAWDKAATKPSEVNPDPDWTAGLKYSRDRQGNFYIEHLHTMRDRPAKVEQAILNFASQDGKGTTVALWQDPGGAGVHERDHFVKLLSSYTVHIERASKDKETYAGPVSSQSSYGNVKVLRGDWNDDFFSQAEAFPPKNKGHDDIIDSLSLAHLVCADDDADWLR